MRTGLAVIFCIAVMFLTGCTNEASPSTNEEDATTQEDTKKTTQMKSQLKTEKITYGPSDPTYKMDVTYDDESHKLTGNMSVSFVNNLDKTLEHIFFNLWPNAKEFDEGGIQIHSVQFNNHKSKFKIKETKLDISGISLKKGEEATVKMNFTVTVPEKKSRFGWSGTHVSLGNWFPILAVYDNEGWNLDPYFASGESFYSVTGDFDVTLKTKKGLEIATTGQQAVEVTIKDEKAVHHFQAKNVRDFAIVMNESFNQDSYSYNGVKVNVFYSEKNSKYADYMKDGAIYSLDLYGKLFGEYPWKELDVIGVELQEGLGMEYPQLVMIDLGSENSSDKFAIYHTTEHEVAHQWFYGAIGNNQYDEPWLDESFSTFASYVAFYDDKINFKWVRAIGKKYYHLTSPVSAFAEYAEEDGLKMYGDVIYDYGAKSLNELRKKLGDDAFYKGMQQYFHEMKFKIATTADFIRIMEQSTGEELSQFFKEHRIYVEETK